MLYLIAWLTDCALILFVFSVTRVLAEQQASPWTLGTLGAAFFLASALSSTLAGRLSDRVGRKVVAISGAIGLVASLLVLLLVEGGAWRFYVAYACAGISVGHVYPPVIALLSQCAGPREASRRFLRFGLAFNLGILFGQVGGGWLYDHLSPTAPLLTATGLAVATVLCLCGVSDRVGVAREGASGETEPEVGPQERASARRFIRLAWLANCAGMFSMSTLWFLFPSLAVSLGIPAEEHGMVLGVGRATVMCVYLLMHAVPIWHHRFRFSVAAQLLGLAGMLMVCVGDRSAAMAMGVVLLSVLLGYNYFASLYYNRSGHVEGGKGAAFGLNEAFLSMGAGGGSLLGGWAASEMGQRAPFQIAAAVIVVGLCVQVAWFLAGRDSSGGSS